jgi:ubiquinol-cytochrome c reductase subunit 8
MRTSLIRASKGFGQLATIRGTTKYHLSPFEQKAFAGVITKGIPNTLWRIQASILYVAPRNTFNCSYLFFRKIAKLAL